MQPTPIANMNAEMVTDQAANDACPDLICREQVLMANAAQSISDPTVSFVCCAKLIIIRCSPKIHLSLKHI